MRKKAAIPMDVTPLQIETDRAQNNKHIKGGRNLFLVPYVEMKMEFMDELSKAPPLMAFTLGVRHTPVRVVSPDNNTAS